MKIKILFMLLFVFSMYGCQPNSIYSKQNVKEQSIKYYDLSKAYLNFFSMKKNNCIKSNHVPYNELNYWMTETDIVPDSPQNIAFSIVDLNNDGIKELIFEDISNNQFDILSIYTMNDRDLVLLQYKEYRSSLKIVNHNIININNYNGGYIENEYCFLPSGKSKLKTVDILASDSFEKKYYQVTDREHSDTKDDHMILKDEYNQIIDSYKETQFSYYQLNKNNIDKLKENELELNQEV